MGKTTGKSMVSHPFGNGLYNLFMVIWGMVKDIVLPTLFIYWANHLEDWACHQGDVNYSNISGSVCHWVNDHISILYNIQPHNLHICMSFI